MKFHLMVNGSYVIRVVCCDLYVIDKTFQQIITDIKNLKGLKVNGCPNYIYKNKQKTAANVTRCLMYTTQFSNMYVCLDDERKKTTLVRKITRHLSKDCQYLGRVALGRLKKICFNFWKLAKQGRDAQSSGSLAPSFPQKKKTKHFYKR